MVRLLPYSRRTYTHLETVPTCLTHFFLCVDVPGPPKDLRVTDITRSTMRLIWKLPDSDGGERIKSYFIEKKCVTDKAWTKVNDATYLLLFFHETTTFP